jgi:hypothetical protein
MNLGEAPALRARPVQSLVGPQRSAVRDEPGAPADRPCTTFHSEKLGNEREMTPQPSPKTIAFQ